MKREIIKASGMSCQHCVMRVTKSLKEIDGVGEVSVDLQSGSITVDCDDGVARDRLETAVTQAGYQVTG